MMAAISTSQSSLVEPRGFSTASLGPHSAVLAFRKKIGSAGIGDAGFLGVVDIVQADGDEFRDAGDRRAEARLAVDGGKLGRRRGAASLASEAGA